MQLYKRGCPWGVADISRMQEHTFSSGRAAHCTPPSMCHSNDVEPSQQDFLNKQDQGQHYSVKDNVTHKSMCNALHSP